MSQLSSVQKYVSPEILVAKSRAIQTFLAQYDQSLSESDIRQVVLTLCEEESSHPTISVENAKDRARSLRSVLSEHGINLSLQKCLEGFAKFSNKKNWSVLSASLSRGPVKGIHNAVQILLNGDFGVEYISSRFGEWIKDSGVEASGMSISNMLFNLYDEEKVVDAAPYFHVGDPRNFMGSNEFSFVALYNGRLGIISEIELAYCPDNGVDRSTLVEGRDKYGSIPLSPSELLKKAEEYQLRVQAFADTLTTEYDKTSFFISDGFVDRLTVCAFTPLDVQAPLTFASPYADKDAIDKLEIALEKAVFAD